MAQEPQTPANAEPAPTPANLTGEDEFNDESIEIPSDDDGKEGDESAEAAPEAKSEPEKKRRGAKRVTTLAHERDAARNYAAQLESELLRERERVVGLESKVAEASTVAMQSFAAKSEADLKEARSQYKASIESGDPEQITQAAEQLASAKATMDDIESWKKSEETKAKPPPAPTQTQQQPQQIQDLPKEVLDWTMDNRYWDRIARDDGGRILLDRGGRPMSNPEFDEEMNQEATMFAAKLERQISKKAVSFSVASPEYFRLIDGHMRSEFPDYFGSDAEDASEAPAPPPQRRSSPVAAPTRTIPQASRNGSSSKATITGDEVRFVMKMVENGGGPKYPKGHPKQFQPMSVDDAKVSFVRQKMNIAKNQ